MHTEETEHFDADRDPDEEIELFDPWQKAFASQNRKNDFLKSLESTKSTDLFDRN